MVTREAKELADRLNEERSKREKESLDEYTYMTMHGVCPDCAVPVKSFWCGFMWMCLSFVCPKCGKRRDTYPGGI